MPPDGGVYDTKGYFRRATMLSHPEHDWDQRFRDGPLDNGFNYSFITMSGIQDPPYAFFENDVLATATGLSYAHRTCVCKAQWLHHTQATTEKKFEFGRRERTITTRDFPQYNKATEAVVRDQIFSRLFTAAEVSLVHTPI